MQFVIINGPNLNLLGTREPHLYGHQTFESCLQELRERYESVTFDYYQSNSEGAIIDKIQEVGFSVDGIILNAAGYSHTSVAIADSVSAITAPVVEVHISQIFRREVERHTSLLSAAVTGTIAGFGLDSYRLAVEALLHYCNK
ncbi:MAG: 3-dehydroquinate dehydratase [Prevotellaceae bacterium]|nr:3-dehydroquinate dehydratase [Prevotellaceae bacterium]